MPLLAVLFALRLGRGLLERLGLGERRGVLLLPCERIGFAGVLLGPDPGAELGVTGRRFSGVSGVGGSLSLRLRNTAGNAAAVD